MKDLTSTPDERGRNYMPALAITGVAAMIGSFLPWVVLHGFLNTSYSGLNGDGRVTAVLGFVVLAVGVAGLVRSDFDRLVTVCGGLTGLVAAGIGLYDRFQIEAGVDSVADGATLVTTIGYGLHLVILSGVTTLAIALVALHAARRPKAELA